MNNISETDYDQEAKDEFLDLCHETLLDMEPDDCVILLDDSAEIGNDNFVGLLRGNGEFVGNYELRNITHIDQLASIPASEYMFPPLATPISFDVESLNPDNVDDLDLYDGVFLDLYFERLNDLFSDQKDNIIEAVNQQKISMSDVFDLIKGQWNYTVSIIPKDVFENSNKNLKRPYTPVVLTKDLVVDVIEPTDTGFRRVQETWATKGELVMQVSQYLHFEKNNQIWRLRLRDDDFETPSLGDKIALKRAQEHSDGINTVRRNTL